jgi:hypothetical protein
MLGRSVAFRVTGGFRMGFVNVGKAMCLWCDMEAILNKTNGIYVVACARRQVYNSFDEKLSRKKKTLFHPCL